LTGVVDRPYPPQSRSPIIVNRSSLKQMHNLFLTSAAAFVLRTDAPFGMSAAREICAF
jgi:hypothetical protein